MRKDISKFVRIIQQKNGIVRLNFEKSNELEIYKFLKENGFGKSKVGKKIIYYQKQRDKIKVVQKDDISYFFYEYLRDGNYKIPNTLRKEEILDAYLKHLPIKENKLYNFILKEELSDNDSHKLLIQSDTTYGHKFESSRLISKINEWGFRKIQSGKKPSDPLYFKSISKDTYIVFRHYNSLKPHDDGFDCTIGRYLSEKHIENEHTIETIKFIKTFRLNEDLKILQEWELE